jgi:hypothetical protein
MPDSIVQLFAPKMGVAPPPPLHVVATTDPSCCVDEI